MEPVALGIAQRDADAGSQRVARLDGLGVELPACERFAFGERVDLRISAYVALALAERERAWLVERDRQLVALAAWRLAERGR